MAKRKFGASIIILLIAAITLVSGTYAWFLVGGFAELFNIGFDVIESKGGIVLQGDKHTYNGGTSGWGTKLERADFEALDFIAEGGMYKPVSSSDANSFLKVTLDGDTFSCEEAPVKASASAESICFNDFTFYAKSDGAELPGDETSGAYMEIKLNGKKIKEDGTFEDVEGTEDLKQTPAVAARVAVSIDGATTIYSLDGDGNNWNAVTNKFNSEIKDVNDPSRADGNGNRIIDAADTNSGDAGLRATNCPALQDGESWIKIYLGKLPANTDATGKKIDVKVWLEGNDKDCVDFEDSVVAGRSLGTEIRFAVAE